MNKESQCLSTSFAIELSPEEAAIALKVHPRTVRNLITRKVLKAKKVRGKWFIERRSLLDYLSSVNGDAPAVAITKEKNLRQLAPYRLCLHVFETFDWQHPEQTIQAFLETQKITILSEIGAGYYSYGGQKIRHYQRALSAGTLGNWSHTGPIGCLSHRSTTKGSGVYGSRMPVGSR